MRRSQSAGDLLEEMDRSLLLNLLFPEADIKPAGRHYLRVSGLSLGGLEVHLEKPVWTLRAENIGGGLLQLVSFALTGEKDNYAEAIAWTLKQTQAGSSVQHNAPLVRERAPRLAKRERFEVLQVAESMPPFRPQDFPLRDRQLQAHWTWSWADGQVAAYSVRFIDEQGEKKVLPLSWAEVKDHVTGTKSWRWWFIRPARLPLYNLPALKHNPMKPTLWVEGEPAADAAIAEFRGLFNGITMFGGGSGLAVTDLSVCRGRLHILFPDCDPVNEKTGRRAGIDTMLRQAAAIENAGGQVRVAGIRGFFWERRSSGVPYSLSVDRTSGYFDVFPAKWDQADPRPRGVTRDDILSLINGACRLTGDEWRDVKRYLSG